MVVCFIKCTGLSNIKIFFLICASAAVVNQFVTIHLLDFCSLWLMATGAVITKSNESKFSFTQQKYKNHQYVDFFSDERQLFYKES